MSPRQPVGYAIAALALIVATIAGAFAFQAAGYPPCDLCLKERLPYYAGMALAALTVAAAWRGPGLAPSVCFAALALLFLGGTAFGIYHSGVEWGFWPGPSDCTGALDHAGSVGDFMRQLQTVKIVRCDAVSIRILGLSLAGWNVVVSLGVVLMAAAGWRLSLAPRGPTLDPATTRLR